MTNWKVKGKPCSTLKRFSTYLNPQVFNHTSVHEVIRRAEEQGKTRTSASNTLMQTSIKKGTVHIKFRYPELLKKLNIFGSHAREWLPPTYGKKRYDDLNAEEQAVIDSFDGGKSAYEVVVANTGILSCKPTQICLPLMKGIDDGENVRNWYKRTYPYDSYALIHPNLTFFRRVQNAHSQTFFGQPHQLPVRQRTNIPTHHRM